MKISRLTDEAAPLVPDIAENRDLPESEQFRVWVKPLSGRQKMAIQRKQASRRSNSGSAAVAIVREIITSQVERVENLQVENADGTFRDVTTGKGLWETIEEGGAAWLAVSDQVIDFAEEGATLDEETAGN